MTTNVLLKLVLFSVILSLWQMVCWLGLVSPAIVASPGAIFQAAALSPHEFADALRVTVSEILVAGVAASAGGIVIGAVLGSLPLVGMAAGPILSSLFAIPLVVWYPFFLLWFGIGPESKIAYAAVSGFFPIALTTMSAVRMMDRRYVLLGQSMGASRGTLLVRFVLPFSLPGIVSGLRIGLSLVVIGVLVTEMLSSTQGLGYVISYHRTMFETGYVYFGIFLALLCALSVNMGLSRLERKLDSWREAPNS